MKSLAILVCALAPALLVLGYGVAKARGSWANEALWNAVMLGASSALAALVVEVGLLRLVPDSLPPVLVAWIMALVVAAVPEETAKFIVLLAIAQRDVDARRLQDIVIQALGVALGFAALENIFYLAAPGEWLPVAGGRAVTAVPGHGIDGLVMGALLTLARVRHAAAGGWPVRALVLPVLLHAAYDFPLFALQSGGGSSLFGALWAGIVALSAVVALVLVNRALRAAADADRLSGRDRRPSAGGLGDALLGAVLLLGGPALGVGVFALRGIDLPAAGAALGILPAALGLDLLVSALRRRRAA